VGSRIVHAKPWNLYGAHRKRYDIILAYKIAIFGPPMTQHESDSVEISV